MRDFLETCGKHVTTVSFTASIAFYYVFGTVREERRKKEEERQKVKEEREAERQRLRDEREAEKQRIRDEKEQERLRELEEKVGSQTCRLLCVAISYNLVSLFT